MGRVGGGYASRSGSFLRLTMIDFRLVRQTLGQDDHDPSFGNTSR